MSSDPNPHSSSGEWGLSFMAQDAFDCDGHHYRMWLQGHRVILSDWIRAESAATIRPFTAAVAREAGAALIRLADEAEEAEMAALLGES